MWIYALNNSTKEVLIECFYSNEGDRKSVVSDFYKMFGKNIVIVEFDKQIFEWSQT